MDPYIREDQREPCYLATQYLTELAVNLIQASFFKNNLNFVFRKSRCGFWSVP